MAPDSRGTRILAALGLDDLGTVGKYVGLATVTGVVGGLVAIAFHWLTRIISDHALRRAAGLEGEGLGSAEGTIWLVVAVPALGGLIVGWLTQRFAPEAEGHGTEQVIRAFHYKAGKVRKRVIGLKAVTSALTIGTGGSAGQEGPVCHIGSSVGSAVADGFKLSARDRRVFLLAGSSAGIGALFSAPLGGALFAPEVLYRKPEFEGDAIIPCIISSIVAYTTFSALTGHGRAVEIAPEVLSRLSFGGVAELPIYVALALACAIVGLIYIRVFDGTHHLFKRLPHLPPFLRPALGGALLGLLAIGVSMLVPGNHGILFGGYGLMHGSIGGALAVDALLILLGAKILATSFSIATGGSGGVFAPSLAIGGLLGAAVGQTAARWFPGLELQPASFALVGMGGFFAGVAKTPIAAILIVCEMTGGYALLAPLMLVSVVHLLFAKRWSIYDTQVPGLVESPAHAGEFVVDVLERISVAEVPGTGDRLTTVSENTTLRKALDVVSQTTGYCFPVLDREERLVGVFSLGDVRRIFLQTGIGDLVIVRDFMVDRVATVTPDDDLDKALSRLNELGIAEIPIVASDDPRRVIGMLTRNQLGAIYHKRLRELRGGSG